MIRRAILIGLLLAIVAVVIVGCGGPSKEQIAAQQRDECFTNELKIKTAIDLVNADSGIYPDVASVVSKLDVKCPSGGTYSFDAGTDTVSCSVHGSKSAPK